MLVRFQKLRTNNSAPDNSTSETAICKTVSPRCMAKRSRLPTIPRPPALNATAGAIRDERIAGVSPKNTQVSIATMLVKPSTRQSASRSRSEEHTSELQSQSNLVCRLLLEKKKDT